MILRYVNDKNIENEIYQIEIFDKIIENIDEIIDDNYTDKFHGINNIFNDSFIDNNHRYLSNNESNIIYLNEYFKNILDEIDDELYDLSDPDNKLSLYDEIDDEIFDEIFDADVYELIKSYLINRFNLNKYDYEFDNDNNVVSCKHKNQVFYYPIEYDELIELFNYYSMDKIFENTIENTDNMKLNQFLYYNSNNDLIYYNESIDKFKSINYLDTLNLINLDRIINEIINDIKDMII